MARCSLTVALLLAALAAHPIATRAQHPAESPLRILCSSPTMSFCASFWTWEVQVNAPGSATWTSMVELFGDGYKGFSGRFTVQSTVYPIGGMPVPMSGTTLVMDEGFYDVADASGAVGNPFGATPADPSVNDIYLVNFTHASPDDICLAGQTCFELDVPEPATVLLMLTGMLGLAAVAWRRREEAA